MPQHDVGISFGLDVPRRTACQVVWTAFSRTVALKKCVLQAPEPSLSPYKAIGVLRTLPLFLGFLLAGC